MLIERSTHPKFISNTYLLADGCGGPAFFVDAGGPVAPLIEAADRRALTPTHVLLTHHHYDHVSELGSLRERWPELKVLISSRERDLLGGGDSEAAEDHATAKIETIEAGETLLLGTLEVRPLHTPGHTAGMLSFLVGDRSEGDPRRRPRASTTAPGGFAGAGASVFTGDTLFKNSVGGVKAPGHTTYSDLRDSIMGTLMELPPDTVIQPGHADESTVGKEWDENAFIRVWRGLDPEGSEPCTALGMPATLVLLGADYDGGTKAWVRWQDGSDDIVPGSRVERIG
jgi:hydroxyacylglutathione hydrolase